MDVYVEKIGSDHVLHFNKYSICDYIWVKLLEIASHFPLFSVCFSRKFSIPLGHFGLMNVIAILIFLLICFLRIFS